MGRNKIESEKRKSYIHSVCLDIDDSLFLDTIAQSSQVTVSQAIRSIISSYRLNFIKKNNPPICAQKQ